ncbi:MAG TPA: MmgE/PrpD family protein [Candidatus Dormibacteraeota bacterium]|nr:MmgE/PrpD family protein [Candidatus Dormibacteraeota bacterium]
MDSISRRMAQFALSLRYEVLSEAVVQMAKRLLLDSVGCALAAVRLKDIQASYKYLQELGGRKQASIIWYGDKTTLPNAALINSLLIRAMDYNDVYWKQDPCHPSDMIPAALAPAEYRGVSGKELVTAIVIAYELEMRLCLAAEPGIREVGWHHASLTQFVSPLVAGRILGLNEDQMVSAVGIAGSSHFTLGGVVASHLTNMKNAADPMATEAGVSAAMLAAAGYTGPPEVFEGKEGLFEVLSSVRWNRNALLDRLGEEFLIRQCGFKAFPTEALTHQPITATLEVMLENKITPREVKEVVVETTKRGVDILSDEGKYHPKTKETADHSLPYCIAVAVAKGNVLPSDFEEKALQDETVLELIPRIKVIANSEIDSIFPNVKRAIVTIATKDGRTFKKQEDFAKGQPERPLSEQELLAKFHANAQAALSERQRKKLVQATLAIEQCNNVRRYLPLLISGKTPRQVRR